MEGEKGLSAGKHRQAGAGLAPSGLPAGLGVGHRGRPRVMWIRHTWATATAPNLPLTQSLSCSPASPPDLPTRSTPGPAPTLSARAVRREQAERHVVPAGNGLAGRSPLSPCPPYLLIAHQVDLDVGQAEAPLLTYSCQHVTDGVAGSDGGQRGRAIGQVHAAILHGLGWQLCLAAPQALAMALCVGCGGMSLAGGSEMPWGQCSDHSPPPRGWRSCWLRTGSPSPDWPRS